MANLGVHTPRRSEDPEAREMHEPAIWAAEEETMGQKIQSQTEHYPVDAMDDTDDPRAMFARVQKQIETYRIKGSPVPKDLERLQRQLVSECAAVSQGR